VIRTDWLDNLGLDAPTNLDEFVEVMKAFTFNDPDGNGEDDTFGMMMSAVHDGYLDQQIAGAFGLGGGGNSIVINEEGEWVPKTTSDRYKEYLGFLNQLWEAGVVYPDISLDNKQFQAYFTDGTVGYMADTWTWVLRYYRPTGWFAATLDRNPDARVEIMDAFREPELAFYSRGASHWRYMMVTKDVSDAKAARIFEILDTQLTDMELHNTIWDGIEGVHHTMSDDGRRIPSPDWASADVYPLVGGKFMINNSRISQEMLTASFGSVVQDLLAFQATWNRTLTPVDSGFESRVLADIGADLLTIESEYKWNVIIGDKNLANDWDVYIDAWRRAGGDDFVAEYEAYIGQ
jgi:putative aldouronate transport system substrate-binding protein